MKINQNLVSESKYSLKCPYEMTPEFIVVHNTANDASAVNEIAYMIRNGYEISYHFAVDDKEIWQGIPINRNAWHAGDGAEGKGNRKGIAIEICYSKSGGERFTAAENLAAEFIAHLLHERGWGIDKVTRHKDYSNKNCPHRTIALGWDRFLRMVQAQLDKLNASAPTVIYRVQVGAYSLRIRAEEMLAKVKAAGFNGVIVEQNMEEPKPVKSDPIKAEPVPTIKEGSKVKIKSGAKTYTGGGLAAFVYNRTYLVKELKGDRAVLTYNGTVVCAMNTANLVLK
jgi:N-acetylmuramoyl-L-alanine amidase CwlA